MSSILSERHKHSSDQAAILFKKIAEELVKQANEQNQLLETIDVRGKGRFSSSLIKYNDERFAFRRTIDVTKDDFELPMEPDTKYIKLWYMMDHLGPQILDVSNHGFHGSLEGHPTLKNVPVDLGMEQWSTEPESIAMNFNTGTDSISALEGELIIVPDHLEYNVLWNDDLFPVYKKFGFMFRFLVTDSSADTSNGIIFRRFATKRDSSQNGWLLAFDDDGDFVFHVLQDNVWYRRKVDDLLLNTIYEVICTYDEQAGSTAADRIKIYIHKYVDAVPGTVTDSSVDDSASSFVLPTNPEYRLFIGGMATRAGYFKGWLQDFRIHAPDNRVQERSVITPAQAKNWFTNKITLGNTAFGDVAIVGLFNLSDETLNPPAPTIESITPPVLNRSMY